MIKNIRGWTENLIRVGHWMQSHNILIRRIQWIVVVVYMILIIEPAVMPMEDNSLHLWSNLALIAEFVFWGVWWPVVLLSMVIFGRVWCGVLCPEGTLTEYASRFGLGRSIPRWIRFSGLPFIAFGITTIYGQIVSVHQYPLPALLVLGGSTCAAILIGFLYGREKRIWCKYLCPVNGVFGLIARISPIHYKVDEAAWRQSYIKWGKNCNNKVISVNCAPLVPLRNMKSSSTCHMCGRCSGYRDAISLSWRSPSYEIVQLGGQNTNPWDTILILYGLLGIAFGAFHWTVSPWFVQIKQIVANWLIDRDIMWPFKTNSPWFILTNYPSCNDVFSWLDGILIISYILTTAFVYGTTLFILLYGAVRMLGRFDHMKKLHHFAQALIPIAGSGIFIGLFQKTLSLLRYEHIQLSWISEAGIIMLVSANIWSAWLAWNITSGYNTNLINKIASFLWFIAALVVVNSAWWLMFYVF
ncbi:MAG: 4Fe-4S binding protein [Burkholderia sp.]|nr:4Fe-4S binding protein [Burkholderia sp.]